MADENKHPVVVLDRIEPGVEPSYCTHGRATCMACDEWVWLGSETVKLVADGVVLPLCLPCAERLLTPLMEKAGHIRDHRRSEGPHG